MHTIADQSTMPAWPAAVWIIVAIVGLIAAWHLIIGLCQAAGREMPDPDEYEMSPYGPILTGLVDQCGAHRPHVMERTAGGSWICTRCQQVWQVEVFDIDDIENYANGGAA